MGYTCRQYTFTVLLSNKHNAFIIYSRKIVYITRSLRTFLNKPIWSVWTGTTDLEKNGFIITNTTTRLEHTIK